MLGISLWRGVLGLEDTAIEDVRLDPDGLLVIDVRPMARQRRRCGRCLRRCAGYDEGSGRRRWRTLDQGTTMAFLEADAPRVRCGVHGVVVAHVPWAGHGAGHTHTFDQQVAWLVVHTSKSAVVELMRIAWRTVGAIITRYWASTAAQRADKYGTDGLEGLSRIGIDEISYKRGHLFLTVVVDHDTGRLVWAAPGRDRATLRGFFDQLGPARSARITHVSADQANWIEHVVTERCPHAVQCADPFHIIKWATEALDEVRRDTWRAARAAGATHHNGRHHGGVQRRDSTGIARKLRNSRYALWKNPDRLTVRQQEKLAWIAKTDPRLHRAYLLKEGLRYVFAVKGEPGRIALTRWLSWARRCRIPAFVHLAKRITAVRHRIEATLEHGLSNALIESVNTKIRLLTRLAFGYHSPQPLIALAMLSLGGHRPQLPGRSPRISQ